MGLPDLHYWFTGTALYLALSSAFATLLAILGIRSMISRKSFGILMLVALVLSAMAWKEAARQGEESKGVADVNIALSASVKDLQAHSTTEGKQLSQLLSQNKELLSQNGALKDVVAQIAKAAHAPKDASLAQLTELIEKMIPRKLSSQQTNKILSKLGVKAPGCVIAVHAEWATPEVESYARQFQAILTRANWMKPGPLRIDINGSLSNLLGVFVLIKDASHVPPCTLPLIHALGAANVSAKPAADPRDIGEADEVWLVVGRGNEG